ncbi:hypothetical protein [Litorisediminicola beolgyonensis]|uniref:Transposase n=1 Tax=Litorisediminicola beolgyonensis TaxID=1173614 RepID=A0ABW3ZEM8_9RHOB
MADSPQTQARKMMVTLIREARDAGWARVKAECKPDMSVTIDASMADPEGGDDFLTEDLKMG